MLKIGLVQLDVIEGDIEGNRRHIQKLVSQYVSDNLDLYAFLNFVSVDMISQRPKYLKMKKIFLRSSPKNIELHYWRE